MSDKEFTDEELQAFADEATRYYLGLWNLLKNAGAPAAVIINAAIENMLAVLEFYLTEEQKLNMLDTISNTVKQQTENKPKH